MQTKRNFSAKREAIYKTITSTNIHPTAEWVYDQLKPEIPNLSLGTVYRNITIFREMKIVKSIGVYNGQERYDSDMSPHSHFICNVCFKIIDIPKGRNFIDKSMYNFVESECDAEVQSHSINFYGLCSQCRNEENTKISFENNH